MTLRSLLSIGVFSIFFSSPASAGCVGTTILGYCFGTKVDYQTSTRPFLDWPAPPGFHWDRRTDSEYQRDNPGAVDWYTGKSTQDSDWWSYPNETTPVWSVGE